MKSSLRKLRGFALHHHGRHGGEEQQQQQQQQQRDKKENAGDLRRRAQLEELVKVSQDMLDMRDCYDSLLSAAAATANSAYEFSESLREMGACLLEKTALNDDEESGKVLLMLGKVQFELQKLVDNYRSHIFQTITIPSESLLNELRTVEEMKRQCDEKRDVYEFMMRRQKEKGRGRGGKGESVSMQQLQAAHEEYDEEATSFVFRLKSLKLGQSHSLLTQAARHHAAQLSFFKKALKSLESVEPHVKAVTEHQHIDYHFSGLEEDEGLEDDDDDDDGAYDVHDDGELSFDYGQNDLEQDLSASRQSMELDTVDLTFPHVTTVESSKENIEGNYRKSFSFKGDIRTGSKSAPLFSESKLDPADRFKQMRQSSTKKFNTYVLPTPGDTKSSNVTASGSLVPRTSKPALSGRTQNLWHSSPIEPKIYEQLLEQRKHSASTVINSQSILRESNNNTAQIRRPPPLADLVFSGTDPLAASDSKKIKRHAFSGPIPRKPWPNKPASVEHPQLFSGPLLQNPMAQLLSSSSPKVSPRVSQMVSPSASPTFVSSPKINELHELPRPPASSASKSSRPLGLVGYSAPLAPKGQVLPASSKSSVSSVASPLPTPSQVTRSFSIPSSGLRAMALKVSRPLEATKDSEVSEDVASPPLTPISLLKPLSTGADADKHTLQL